MMEAPAPSTLSLPPRPRARPDGRGYFLVLEGDTSAIFDLPAEGVVLIGRDGEADLALADLAVSRRHAKVMVAPQETRVVDLDSHNGTLVNGERVDGARVLASGDVVQICGATLVFRRGRCAHPERTALDGAGLRRRLEEEIVRARRSGGGVAVACVRAARPTSDVVRAVAAAARFIDVVAEDARGDVLVVLPDLPAEAALAAAQTAVAAVAALGRDARAGLAVAGLDGCDADTLLEAAAGAVVLAGAGGVGVAASGIRRLEIGDRRIIVGDPVMAQTYALLQRLAASDLSIAIQGPNGAGKENAAFAVHAWSRRGQGPFVTLNCAALPETLVESELFGYDRGAFSGANQNKPGLFETAHQGTLFLDEIGELPLAMQPKLLRVLESGKILRLGSTHERVVDVRFVAATNRDLRAAVKAGRFREDLYYRIASGLITLPALRERPREIPVLAQELLARAAARQGRPAPALSLAALHCLTTHDWPGNVRELKNAMEYAVAIAGDEVEPWHLPPTMADAPPPVSAPPASAPHFRPLATEVEELKRRRIEEALAAAEGVHVRAAELIGMPLRTFQERLRHYGIARRRT